MFIAGITGFKIGVCKESAPEAEVSVKSRNISPFREKEIHELGKAQGNLFLTSELVLKAQEKLMLSLKGTQLERYR